MIGHESQTDSHEQHPLKDHTSQLLSMVFLKINGTDLYPNVFFLQLSGIFLSTHRQQLSLFKSQKVNPPSNYLHINFLKHVLNAFFIEYLFSIYYIPNNILGASL